MMPKHVAQTVPKNELLKAGFFPEDSRPIPSSLRKGGKLSPSNALVGDESDHEVLETANDKNNLERVTFVTQVSMLLQREWRNILRNKKALAARFIFTTVMSFLLGVIFWQIGDRSLASFRVSIITTSWIID